MNKKNNATNIGDEKRDKEKPNEICFAIGKVTSFQTDGIVVQKVEIK